MIAKCDVCGKKLKKGLRLEREDRVLTICLLHIAVEMKRRREAKPQSKLEWERAIMRAANQVIEQIKPKPS